MPLAVLFRLEEPEVQLDVENSSGHWLLDVLWWDVSGVVMGSVDLQHHMHAVSFSPPWRLDQLFILEYANDTLDWHLFVICTDAENAKY